MIKKILSVAIAAAFVAGLVMTAAEAGRSVEAGDGPNGNCSACWGMH